MNNLICKTGCANGLALASGNRTAPVFVASSDWPGVLRAARDLAADFGRVTGTPAEITAYGATNDAGDRAAACHAIAGQHSAIIAGTVGRSPIIDGLVATGRLDAAFLEGRREAFSIRVLDDPLPGFDRALVIAGSDKRGTIFGIYEVSARIGVSPWYWWADVPAGKASGLFADPRAVVEDAPAVRYRGIFLNDEYPALTNWVAATYGEAAAREDPPVPEHIANYGHEFYARVFELLLRLKANYLWPAMWNNAFNEDDPANAALADEYGIVMGNSHQEPMLRAQKEWDRRYQKAYGHWNYAKHPDVLEKFWREGMERNRGFESIVSIGLRGADDTEMAPGGPAANRALLETIVDRQRRIISEVTGKPPEETPQLWCLYKEMQEYYEDGMRVPDDVTLLWAEDNWGNQRRLPTAAERKRPGGAGIYYHFDYHGGPRSYQWTNTVTAAKIFDQMALAREYGADRVWIVNVGHLKGYEYPLSFFMDLAWAPERFNGENLDGYAKSWTESLFGTEHAEEGAILLETFTRWNSRRKSELLAPDTWSLVNYNEAERVTADWHALEARADAFMHAVTGEMRDAAYQLILFPIRTSAILADLYVAAGKNALYAKQGRVSALSYADRVRQLFGDFRNLVDDYNGPFANGKWAHFMDQAVLGYKGWADPPRNNIDHIKLYGVDIPDRPLMGVAVEGSVENWPAPGTAGTDCTSMAAGGPALPGFDCFTKAVHWIDIYNRGSGSFAYLASPSDPWILATPAQGTIRDEQRVAVAIDWEHAPEGSMSGTVLITGMGESVLITVSVLNPGKKERARARGFVETDLTLAIEAEHFTENVRTQDRGWTKIAGFGKTLSGMRARAEVDPPAASAGKAQSGASAERGASAESGASAECCASAPYLEYAVWFFHTGKAKIILRISPVLNFIPGEDVRIGVSLDDESAEIIVAVPSDYRVTNENRDWEKSVIENGRDISSVRTISEAGAHVIRVWMISPGPVLERITVDMGGLRPSCLGPPESFRAQKP